MFRNTTAELVMKVESAVSNKSMFYQIIIIVIISFLPDRIYSEVSAKSNETNVIPTSLYPCSSIFRYLLPQTAKTGSSFG